MGPVFPVSKVRSHPLAHWYRQPNRNPASLKQALADLHEHLKDDMCLGEDSMKIILDATLQRFRAKGRMEGATKDDETMLMKVIGKTLHDFMNPPGEEMDFTDLKTYLE